MTLIASRNTLKKSIFLKSLASVFGLVFLARLLGICQDSMMARMMNGVSAETDAFITAMRAPRIFKTFFSETLFSATLIPFTVRFLQNYEKPRAERLLTLFLICSSIFMSFACFLIWLYPGTMIHFFAPGIRGETFDFATVFLPRMFLLLFFVANSEIISAGLKSIKEFSIPAIGNIIQAATLIVGFFLGIKFKLSLTTVSWALAAGSFFELISRLSGFWYFNFWFKKPTSETFSDAKDTLKQMAPLVFGLGVTQVQLIVEGVVGSFLSKGEITILHNSYRLFHFFSMFLTIPISAVILPYLVESNLKSKERLNFLFLEIGKFLTLASIFCMFFFYLFSSNLFAWFYARTISDILVQKSTVVILPLIHGLLPTVLFVLMSSCLFALKDTTSHTIANLTSIFLNLALCSIGRKMFGLSGIVWASSIGGICGLCISVFFLAKKHGLSFDVINSLKFISQSILVFIPLLFISSKILNIIFACLLIFWCSKKIKLAALM